MAVPGTPQASLPGLAMVTGAVQVPPDGQPIVLGPDHGTVGGYPLLAVVHPDDMGALMQRPAGLPVRFALASAAGPVATRRRVVEQARLVSL